MINLRGMNNIYYMIWADAILSFREHNPTKSNWKFRLFIFMTWMQALNVWIIFLWLKYYDILQIPLIDISIFPGEMLDEFFAFSIEFAMPFGLLNYFLIFYRDRYKKVTKKYSGIKPKYALIYSFTIIFGAFISAIFIAILT